MYNRTIISTPIAIFIGLSLLVISTQIYANDSDTNHQTALKLAREGNLQKSIRILQGIIKQHPETMRFQYDYILVLNWDGNDDEVLAQASKINISDAPVYVLEAVARATRNKKLFKKSEKLYRIALQKMPDRTDSKLGLASVLIDRKKPKKALNILLPLKKTHPDNTNIYSVLGYAYQAQGNWLDALALYDRMLVLDTNNQIARRSRIFMLDKIGATTLAYNEAKQYEALFKKEEMAKIRWNRAAFLVRSGKIDKEDGTPRFEDMDESIRFIQENIEYANALPSGSSTWWLMRAKFDLIVALHSQFRMQEVIGEYLSLKKQQVEIPSYVSIAVADAYLYLEQPEEARDLYQSVLSKKSDKKRDSNQIFNVRISLYFALLEAEQNKEATTQIQQLADSLPIKLKFRNKSGRPARSKNNSRKMTAELLAAMDYAYNDDLQETQIRLEKLLKKAPNNQEIRNALANVYHWRGWPRKSEKLHQLVREYEPNNKEIQISQIQRLTDLRKYRQAETALGNLMTTHSYHQELQRQSRLWDIHNDWEFSLEVNGGESSGSQEGSKDLGFESYLYSKPIGYKYRPFVRYKWGEGDFPEGKGSGFREGVGIEYSVPDWLLTAELHHNQFANSHFGGRLAAQYDYDDFLSFSTSFDSLASDTPLRALSNGVEAKTINGGINYRVSESRDFDLSAGYMTFSDDNDRYNVAGSYKERWLTGARYKFSTVLELYHSGNSSSDGPYFSPSKDLALGLTLDNEYLTYRDYDFTMHQNLKINIGNYWQETFNSGIVGSVLYEHQWSASDKTELAYGINGFSKLYDADREDGWQAYLRLNWRF